MRNYFCALVLVLVCCSCKSQEKTIEYENKNLIIFKDIDPTIKVVDNNMSKYLFTFKNLIFIKDFKYSDVPRPMKLSFVKNKDTMNIIFSYRNSDNVYIKNFEFKKGNYRIIANIYTNSKKHFLKSEEIPTQKIISKNKFMGKDNDRKDVEVKDMIFYEADLNDTINVKFKKND